MASLDIDSLLAAIDEDAPCGVDLAEEHGFFEFEQLLEGTPERQRNDGSIAPAEPPDWKKVKSVALDLLQRSKDIRVITNLSRALITTDGFSGFRDGLQLLSGVIDQYWDTVYPELDADDDMDPTERVNAIASLADYAGTLVHLTQAILVDFAPVGRFSLRDYRIANGLVSKPDDMDSPPDPQLIDAAFRECDQENLIERATALEQSLSILDSIDSTLMEAVGPGRAPDLSALRDALKEPLQVLNGELEKRGVGTGTTTDEVAQPVAGSAPVAAAVPGEINTRDDAIRAMERIADYFIKNEPSSPVPLLLDRAKRLVTMGFIDIVQDLAPDGLDQAYIRTGVEKPAEEY